MRSILPEATLASFFSEFEKIASVLAQAPSESMEAPEGQEGRSTEILENERSPAHGIVASRVEQLDPKRALGIPVVQPPPGYVYAPELSAFVPDQQDPGWMPMQQAQGAAQNKGWYDQGQQDLQTGQAQEEVDQIADQDVAAAQQQAQQEQSQQQQTQQVQQVETLKAQQKAMGEAARAGFEAPTKKSSTPSRGTTKKKSKSHGQESGKGVTIRIGR